MRSRKSVWLVSASFVILPFLLSCKSQMVESKKAGQTPAATPQVTPTKNSIIDMEPQRKILLESLERLENSNPTD